jgi:hypothetical protein
MPKSCPAAEPQAWAKRGSWGLLNLVLKSFNKATVEDLYASFWGGVYLYVPFVNAFGVVLVKRLTEVYSNSPPRQPSAGVAVDSLQHSPSSAPDERAATIRETVFPTGVME